MSYRQRLYDPTGSGGRPLSYSVSSPHISTISPQPSDVRSQILHRARGSPVASPSPKWGENIGSYETRNRYQHIPSERAALSPFGTAPGVGLTSQRLRESHHSQPPSHSGSSVISEQSSQAGRPRRTRRAHSSPRHRHAPMYEVTPPINQPDPFHAYVPHYPISQAPMYDDAQGYYETQPTTVTHSSTLQQPLYRRVRPTYPSDTEYVYVSDYRNSPTGSVGRHSIGSYYPDLDESRQPYSDTSSMSGISPYRGNVDGTPKRRRAIQGESLESPPPPPQQRPSSGGAVQQPFWQKAVQSVASNLPEAVRQKIPAPIQRVTGFGGAAGVGAGPPLPESSMHPHGQAHGYGSQPPRRPNPKPHAGPPPPTPPHPPYKPDAPPRKPRPSAAPARGGIVDKIRPYLLMILGVLPAAILGMLPAAVWDFVDPRRTIPRPKKTKKPPPVGSEPFRPGGAPHPSPKPRPKPAARPRATGPTGGGKDNTKMLIMGVLGVIGLVVVLWILSSIWSFLLGGKYTLACGSGKMDSADCRSHSCMYDGSKKKCYLPSPTELTQSGRLSRFNTLIVGGGQSDALTCGSNIMGEAGGEDFSSYKTGWYQKSTANKFNMFLGPEIDFADEEDENLYTLEYLLSGIKQGIKFDDEPGDGDYQNGNSIHKSIVVIGASEVVSTGLFGWLTGKATIDEDMVGDMVDVAYSYLKTVPGGKAPVFILNGQGHKKATTDGIKELIIDSTGVGTKVVDVYDCSRIGELESSRVIYAAIGDQMRAKKDAGDESQQKNRRRKK